MSDDLVKRPRTTRMKGELVERKRIALDELIHALEKAPKGGSRELDVAVWKAIGGTQREIAEVGGYKHVRWIDRNGVRWPHKLTYFTTSIDAALTVIPEGWYWRTGCSALYEGWARLNKHHPDHCNPEDEASATAHTPAIALCIAVVIAHANILVHKCARCGEPNPEHLQMDGCRDPDCPEQT